MQTNILTSVRVDVKVNLTNTKSQYPDIFLVQVIDNRLFQKGTVTNDCVFQTVLHRPKVTGSEYRTIFGKNNKNFII